MIDTTDKTSSRAKSTPVAVWTMLSLFAAAGGTACVKGGVEHPADGGKGTVGYCASAEPEEQNCMACSAKPGCGFCASPSGDAPVCQPGIPGDDQPATCAAPLITSTSDCSAPPPPID